MRIVVMLVALLGCSKQDENDWAVRDAKKDLAALKQTIANPKSRDDLISDAITRCGHMANLAILEKHDKALAAELKQLCTQDIYLAQIKSRIDEIEAKRKIKPADELGLDCIDPFYENSKTEMTAAGTIAAAKDLIARYEALCPPDKK